MAAGLCILYDNGFLNIINDNVNLSSDTLLAILVKSTYTPVKGTHATYADVSAHECDDVGYAPVVLTSKSFTLIDGATNGEILVDCANISFGSSVTLTGKYIVIVKRAGGSLASTDKLVAYGDLNTSGGSVSSTSSNFDVNTPNGLFSVVNPD